MRCIYLAPLLSIIPFAFSSPLPLQPMLLENTVDDISTLLEKRSASSNRKEGPSYHYPCKATDFIFGLELEQENNQTLCEYLDPDGNTVLTSAFAPAFKEHQEIEEVSDEFINTNRIPNHWIFKDKNLCYFHRVEPLQKHCLKTREVNAESGSGAPVIPDKTPAPPVETDAPAEPPETTIDIPATAGGIVMITTGLILITVFIVEARFHCMFKGCKLVYKKVQLSLP
ncbi:hypothetical protein [Endozoicomonas numazuensis]|uniref:Uncharacterized protein n=1 Tax=Endozoicomonas numazuensis TaxID=1137799 RepID=A0A081NDF7_9GAMM|nr:hypothetical protein [Endozoicomonas numazuensis]KEQ16480.1 hypothetical protein GZ78_21730 [Endozoicomonas numazuensis]